MLPREKDGVVDTKLKVRHDLSIDDLWLLNRVLRFMGQRISVLLTYLLFHFKLDHTLKASVEYIF